MNADVRNIKLSDTQVLVVMAMMAGKILKYRPISNIEYALEDKKMSYKSIGVKPSTVKYLEECSLIKPIKENNYLYKYEFTELGLEYIEKVMR